MWMQSWIYNKQPLYGIVTKHCRRDPTVRRRTVWPAESKPSHWSWLQIHILNWNSGIIKDGNSMCKSIWYLRRAKSAHHTLWVKIKLGAGASPLRITRRLQTDMNLQLVSSWRLFKVCDSVWGFSKGHVCEAMNFLRQATIPERLYLGRITSTARYNLTFVPRGSHTALLTNDSVTVGLCPRWNRLKRTKHVFAVECRATRQI